MERATIFQVYFRIYLTVYVCVGLCVWVLEVAKRKLTILKLELSGNCKPPSSSGRNQTWILWKSNKLSEALSYPSSPVFKGFFYLYYMCRGLKATIKSWFCPVLWGPGIGHQACAARAVTSSLSRLADSQHRFLNSGALAPEKFLLFTEV